MNVFADSTRSFRFDAAGQLAGYTDSRNTTPSCAWNDDEGQRCTYASQQTLRNESYTWDKVGNPTYAGAVVSTGDRLTQLGSSHAEYDADGNVTRRYGVRSDGSIVQDFRFHWNSLNQLDTVTWVGACTVPGRTGTKR